MVAKTLPEHSGVDLGADFFRAHLLKHFCRRRVGSRSIRKLAEDGDYLLPAMAQRQNLFFG